MSEHYNTIIIGAGLSGLSAAALLAVEEGQKVLVLEKEDYLGGRLVSFTGQDNKLMLHGKALDVKAYGKVMASVYAWVARAEPDLDTMLSKGLLNGFSFEAGGHATFWGTKGRVGHLLSYLGKPVDLPGNEGFSVIDPEKFQLHIMEKGGNRFIFCPAVFKNNGRDSQQMADIWGGCTLPKLFFMELEG